MNILNTDILLDEEAFKIASQNFKKLADDMETLRKNVNQGLKDLETGFQTPAGKKYVQTFQSKLLDPVKNQVIVIEHVAENLIQAKTQYESVFDEYKQLNNSIK